MIVTERIEALAPAERATVAFEHLRAGVGIAKATREPLTLDSTVREVQEALGDLGASCTVGGLSPESPRRRLSALAPTALEAIVALANAVRREGGLGDEH